MPQSTDVSADVMIEELVMQELSDVEVDAVAGGLVIGLIVMGPLAAAVAEAVQLMSQEPPRQVAAG